MQKNKLIQSIWVSIFDTGIIETSMLETIFKSFTTANLYLGLMYNTIMETSIAKQCSITLLHYHTIHDKGLWEKQ